MLGKIKQSFIVIYVLSVASVTFCLTVFPASMIALPFSRENKLKVVNHAWKIFAILSLKLAFFCKLEIQDDRPSQLQSKHIHHGLFIGNHSSLLDIPLFLTFLRIPPIMKKAILYYPIFGICAYTSGAIFVDRNSKSSRKRVLEIAISLLTKEVGALQYYPEGTRQKHGLPPKDYSQIKTTMMQIAFEKNIPIYTFSFYGTPKALGGSIFDVHLGKTLGAHFRDKLEPCDFSSKEEFCKAAWSQVQNDYKELEARLN